jgi:hypothetical protein
MSSPAAVKKFIAVVELHFPRPKFDGDEQMEAAWVQTIKLAAKDYSDEVVGSAGERILLTRNPKRDGRFFPSPQECIEAFDKAAAYRQQQATPLLEKPPELTYEEKTNLARDIMQAPLGLKAKKEGWGVSMFQFVVDHQRAPQGSEIDACKASARDFAAAKARLANGDHPLSGPWARYAENMVRKARELMGEKVA